MSNLLLIVALVLVGLKFGLRQRLRELGRLADRIVNIALVVILLSYAIQLGFLFLGGR